MKRMFFNLIIKANQSERVSFEKESPASYGMFESEIDVTDYPEMDSKEEIVILSHKIFEKLKASSKLDPEIKLKVVHSSKNIAQTNPDQKIVYLSSGYFLSIAELAKTRPELASEDEIAATLAHELAHNLFKHDEFNETPFIEEYEADKHALEIIDKAGYNVRASLNFFERLSAKESRKLEGGDPSFLRFTHPSSFRRKAALENLIDKKFWLHSDKIIEPIKFSELISEQYQKPSSIENISILMSQLAQASHPARPFENVKAIQTLLEKATTQSEILLILNGINIMLFKYAKVIGGLNSEMFELNEDFWLYVKGLEKKHFNQEDLVKNSLLALIFPYLAGGKVDSSLVLALEFFSQYQMHHQNFLKIAEKKLKTLGLSNDTVKLLILEKHFLFEGHSDMLLESSPQLNEFKDVLKSADTRHILMSVLETISNKKLLEKIDLYQILSDAIDHHFWPKLSDLYSDIQKLKNKKLIGEDKYLISEYKISSYSSEEFDLDIKNSHFSLPLKFLFKLWQEKKYKQFFNYLFENFNHAGMWGTALINGRISYVSPLLPLRYLVSQIDSPEDYKLISKFKTKIEHWVRAVYAVHFVETKSDKKSNIISDLLFSLHDYQYLKNLGEVYDSYSEVKVNDIEGTESVIEDRYNVRISHINSEIENFLNWLNIKPNAVDIGNVNSEPHQFEFPTSLKTLANERYLRAIDFKLLLKDLPQNYSDFSKKTNDLKNKLQRLDYKYILYQQISNWLSEKITRLKSSINDERLALDLYDLQMLIEFEQYDEFKKEFPKKIKKIEKALSEAKNKMVNESDFELKEAEDYLTTDQKIVMDYLDKGYQLALAEKRFDGLSYIEQLQLLSEIYPISWTVRDKRILAHFKNQKLMPDQEVLLLNYLVNPYLRIQNGEKLFAQIQDLAKLNYDDHLNLIIKYFPDYSLLRDEKLNHLLQTKGFSFEQAQLAEKYFTEYGFLYQSETVHFQNVGLESLRDLMSLFDAGTRVAVFLWIIDLGPEPWVLRELRQTAQIPIGSFKQSVSQSSPAEKELFLKEFLIGPVGLLTSRRTTNIEATEQLYDRLFTASVSSSLSIKHRQQLKLIFVFLMNGLSPQKKVNCLLAMINTQKEALGFGKLITRFLEEMGVLGIKIAQYLVSRTKILPPDIELEFLKLTDRAKPISKTNVFRYLQKILGDQFSKITEVQDVLGSASIKQVQVVKFENGDLAAIKMQRPGLKEGLPNDFALIDRLFLLIKNNRALFGEYHLPESFSEEIKATLLNEIQFKKEVEHQKIIAKNIEKRSKKTDKIKIAIPSIYSQIKLSEELIAEQYVQGSKRWEDLSLLEKSQFSMAIVSEIFDQIFNDKIFHADPHPGNMLFKNNHIYLIDFGQVGHLTVENEKWLFSLLDSFLTKDFVQLEGQLLRLHQNTPEAKRKNITSELTQTKIRQFMDGVNSNQQSILLQVQDFILLLNELGIYLPDTFYLLLKTLSGLNYLIETDSIKINDFIYHFIKTKYQKFKLNPLTSKYKMNDVEKKAYYQEVQRKDYGTANIDLSDIKTLSANTFFKKIGDEQIYYLEKEIDLTDPKQKPYFALRIKNKGEENLSGLNAGVHFFKNANLYETFVKNEWVNLQDLLLTVQSQRLIKSESAEKKWKLNFIQKGTRVRIPHALLRELIKSSQISKADSHNLNVIDNIESGNKRSIYIETDIIQTVDLNSDNDLLIGAMGTPLKAKLPISPEVEIEFEGKWISLQNLRIR